MLKRVSIITISFISAFFLMSGGYGYWSKGLIIKGSIEVREVPEKKAAIAVELLPAAADQVQAEPAATEVQGNPMQEEYPAVQIPEETTAPVAGESSQEVMVYAEDKQAEAQPVVDGASAETSSNAVSQDQQDESTPTNTEQKVDTGSLGQPQIEGAPTVELKSGVE